MSPQRRVIPPTRLLVAVATILVGVNGPAITIGAMTESPLLDAPSAGQAGPVAADSLSSPSTTPLATAATVAPTDYTTTTVSTTTYSETSSRIVYHGTWGSASDPSYLGGRIKYSRQRSASAVFSFTGTAVSWYGPVGPTRGKAMVYVNGTYLRTVSLYASSFVARHRIWSASSPRPPAR